MGYKVSENRYVNWGTAFGLELEEYEHGPYDNVTAAWEKVVALAMRDMAYTCGTMTVFPYQAICYEEFPDQGYSNWFHTVEEEAD